VDESSTYIFTTAEKHLSLESIGLGPQEKTLLK